MRLIAISLLTCAACNADPFRVAFTGTVFDSPDDDAAGLPGVDLVVRDIQSDTISSTQTDDSGAFEAEVLAQTAFFVALSHDDHLPTAFTGLAGGVDVEAVAGDLWLRSQDEIAALREEFAATCDSADAEGAIIEGEARLYIPGNDPETLPLVTTATMLAWDTDGTSYTACYLANEGGDDGGGVPRQAFPLSGCGELLLVQVLEGRAEGLPPTLTLC